MSAPSPEAFAAARQAAYNCAEFADRIIQATTHGDAGKPPAAVERLLEQFRVTVTPDVAAANPWLIAPRPNPAVYLGAGLVEGLCRAMDLGRHTIEPVEEHLLRVATAPVRLGSMTRATAHRLAWDFATNLWSTVRFVLLDHGYMWTPDDGFSLDYELMRREWQDVCKALTQYKGLDAQAVAQAVLIESARAAARNTLPDGKSSTPPEDHKNGDGAGVRKPKRSTENGEARRKIIAGLSEHHRYENGGCLYLEPIRVNAFAEKIEVGTASVSDFLREKFGSHAKYRAACRKPGELAFSLRLVRDEFSPRDILDPSLLNKIADQNRDE